MENLSPKAQAGLLIGLLAIFYLIGYLVFIKGWYSSTASYNKQIEKLDKEIKEAKKLTKHIEQFRAKKKDLQNQLKILKQILPSKEEAGQLYSKLNKMAQESGVEIVEIKAGQKKPMGITFELPYKIKMKARYHDVGFFFAKLANFEKIINITEFKMEKPKKITSKYSVFVDCTASTYIYNENADNMEADNSTNRRRRR
ncbi:type IV pilus assembly protein PilO [Thermotomaculum hydrothermale]|uniref:Type IV pilus assembly protein PilO n=1 Tax=Thermotomaculum hydrothermale TaxID=981385 RepID=A0A7R6PKK0_9BACT|nr:type 4a pilus biogenesis protein PilO [Thermotomaculum hydrothermale]BBB31852.1 type IV pilus assembly protein PilO [Thermotomaculum hydrothermale]